MEQITKEMPIGDVVQNYPQTIEVFLKHGLMCFGCAIARFENVEQGAMLQGKTRSAKQVPEATCFALFVSQKEDRGCGSFVAQRSSLASSP
jgi:hybrid cluster-associated redox disulfide protein